MGKSEKLFLVKGIAGMALIITGVSITKPWRYMTPAGEGASHPRDTTTTKWIIGGSTVLIGAFLLVPAMADITVKQ